MATVALSTVVHPVRAIACKQFINVGKTAIALIT
jgi:hypothetical protein